MAAAKKKVAKKAEKRTTRAPRTEPKRTNGGAGVAEPRLSEAAQIFAVTELASFRPLSEVMEALKNDFGVEIARQSVQRYDPTTYAGQSLNEKLKALFHATRKLWLEETSNIAIAGRAGRLRRLERMADKAENMNNLGMAKDIVKQAAEEMGDVFTNKRTLDGKLGVEAVAVTKLDLSELTTEQLLVLDKLSGAMAGKSPSPR